VAVTEDYDAAAAAVADLVGRIPADRMDGPGLGEWDLRALVGHTSRALVTVETYLLRPAERVDVTDAAAYYAVAGAGIDPADVLERGRQAGAALGADPAAAFTALAHRVPAAAREYPAGYLLTTVAGGMPLAAYLRTRVFELVVHGLDIARAAGVPARLPDAVVADAVQLAGQVAVLTGRGEEVLLALTGRARLPAHFSVV
jgi:uncharacterized protein (TIGR03083 family)